MPPVKQDFEGRECQYLITDGRGNITNVSEGLFHDYGLNAKFFTQQAIS
jgi:hypothetical protein